MQIIETKNNLAKITYNPEQNPLVLSCFLVLRDQVQMFLAQVINLDSKDGKHYAIIKLLFNINEQGGLVSYNGGMPSVTSEIEQIRFQDVLKIIDVSSPLTLGNIEQENTAFIQDITLLNGKTLVCVDKQDEKEKFISTILPQMINNSCKIVLFDTLGVYPAQNKMVAGENFKLPLNYETINFIYEKGLPDASGETKALIQEIFLEVQKYVKQIPEQFIPFENFKNVVDAQYEETQINELVLLKNRLLKFYDNGVFAQNMDEFRILEQFLMNSPVTVIDISKFGGELQREIISYVYKIMKNLKTDFYSFIEVEDANTDKKLLKQIFITPNVNSTIISPYKYKYLKEIKQLSKNLILFAPIQQQDDFAGYNVFLSKLNYNEFIVYGEKTKYIPFIVSALPEQKLNLDSVFNHEISSSEEMGMSQQFQDESQEEIPQQFQEEPVEFQEEEIPQQFQEEPVEFQEEEIPQQFQEEPVEFQEEEIPQQFQEEPVEFQEEEIPQQFQEEPVEFREEEIPQQFQEEPVEFQEEEIPQQFQEEPVEFREEEIPQQFQDDIDDTVNQEIIEDINRMESNPNIYDDTNNTLSDEDLDFIEQNIQQTETAETHEEFDGEAIMENIPDDDEDIIPQYQEEEEFKETPIVPVYPAEQPQTPASDGEFVQGDIVMHNTYGKGVVEKIISYGQKTLCSINFEGHGKKLLDPAITQLTKM